MRIRFENIRYIKHIFVVNINVCSPSVNLSFTTDFHTQYVCYINSHIKYVYESLCHAPFTDRQTEGHMLYLIMLSDDKIIQGIS